MRTLHAALAVACMLVALSAAAARAAEYDACDETFYDSTAEPCGGGHQHAAGQRDENTLELSRHRHRYLEVQIKQLEQTVAKLSDEVAQLKKAAAK